MRLSTRNLILGVIVGCGLVWGGYVQYQDPRVRELFGTSPPLPRPLRISQPTGAPPAGKQKKVRKMPPTKPQPVRAQKPGPQSIAANRQLASTILGILAARQLASGISLTVTDDALAVIGQVGDKEKKRRLLEVLDNARGHRRLDSTLLTVSSAPPY